MIKTVWAEEVRVAGMSITSLFVSISNGADFDADNCSETAVFPVVIIRSAEDLMARKTIRSLSFEITPLFVSFVFAEIT